LIQENLMSLKQHPVARRTLIKAAAQTPIALSLASWGQWANAASEKAVVVRFDGMPAPVTIDEMTTVHTAAKVHTYYDSGRKTSTPLAYKKLYSTGEKVQRTEGGTIVAGGYFDVKGQPILDKKTGEQLYSDCPDGQCLIEIKNPRVKGVKGNPVFLVTQFEYLSADAAGEDMYGKLPSSIAIATLDQDPKSGEMSLVSYSNVDTSAVHGLWITCAASLSPWNTHLSSEEYEPDAFKASTDKQFKAFCENTLGRNGNPYHYGHVPEVTVHADGTGSIKKHYNMGRISRELVQVMPDRRTVLMGDDYTGGGIFMFIADREEDLSSGTLYVSGGEVKDGQMTMKWVRLGHATSAEIEALANRVSATDIFEVSETKPSTPGFVEVPNGKGTHWLKVQPGMEKAAAFLETHRYAAMMGGVMEFTKFEGVTVNVKDKTAYLAISSIKSTMSDDKGQWQIKKLSAGGVFEAKMEGRQTDASGAMIESTWVPTKLKAMKALLGKDLKPADAAGNTADLGLIANPDNLKFSNQWRTLFIGEDSGMHVNNIVWAYNLEDGSLTRLLSVPAGAECTGLSVVENCNGHAYVLSNFQHPGDRKFTADQTAVSARIKQIWDNNRAGAVGYISGMPVMG
jgi:secreted PhoX family phosphatase